MATATFAIIATRHTEVIFADLAIGTIAATATSRDLADPLEAELTAATFAIAATCGAEVVFADQSALTIA